jgi:acetyl-CoA C-acetyltransferase
VAAARKVLHIAGLSTSQIDLFEVRDSFAAATVYFMRQLGVPIDRFNVNGSSIALGHPLGATGAMLVSTLIDELERRSLRTGLAAITGAMGVASAVIIETVA